MFSDGRGSDSAVQLVSAGNDRRMASDRRWYTLDEFRSYYGIARGFSLWKEAASQVEGSEATLDSACAAQPSLEAVAFAAPQVNEATLDSACAAQPSHEAHVLAATESSASRSNESVLVLQNSVAQPMQKPQAIRVQVFRPLLDRCTRDAQGNRWVCPQPQPVVPGLSSYPWPVMLGFGPEFPRDKVIANIVPTFFEDEPDSNQQNKPRLDIVVSFQDGVTVRYHPSAKPIWSTDSQPTAAMQGRHRLAAKLAKHRGA